MEREGRGKIGEQRGNISTQLMAAFVVRHWNSKGTAHAIFTLHPFSLPEAVFLSEIYYRYLDGKGLLQSDHLSLSDAAAIWVLCALGDCVEHLTTCTLRTRRGATWLCGRIQNNYENFKEITSGWDESKMEEKVYECPFFSLNFLGNFKNDRHVLSEEALSNLDL